MIALPGHVVRRATRADAAAIQALLERDAAGYALLEGGPVRPDEAELLLAELPPDTPPERKHVLLVDDVALIDLVEGYPEPRTLFLGLIFVVPAARGGGLGTRLIEAMAAHVRAAGGAKLRLGVLASNTGARRLYDRLGFAHVKRTTRTSRAGLAQELDVLELAV